MDFFKKGISGFTIYIVYLRNILNKWAFDCK